MFIKKIKENLKNQKGSTLFESLTGLAILIIVLFMLLGGFLTARKLMGIGDRIDEDMNFNKTEISINGTTDMVETPKTINMYIGGAGPIKVKGKIITYQKDANKSAELSIYVAE